MFNGKIAMLPDSPRIVFLKGYKTVQHSSFYTKILNADLFKKKKKRRLLLVPYFSKYIQYISLTLVSMLSGAKLISFE